MNLLALTVRAFGPFRGEVRLGGLMPGLNVLAAPNETGKSTLFTALQHGFFTPYKTNDKQLKELVPWSTNLGPEVEIDFEHGPLRYRVHKAFLRGPSCLLSEWTGTRFEPKLRDEEADDFLRQLMAAVKPDKGVASRPEHLGLARLLWVPQGPDSLDPPVPAAQVTSRLKSELGSLTADPVEDRLLARLQREYALAFTQAKGDVARNSELARARARLAECDGKLRAVRQQLGQVRENSRTLAERSADLEQAKAPLQVARQQLEQQEAEAARVHALKHAVALASIAFDGITARAAVLRQDRQILLERRARRGELADSAALKQDELTGQLRLQEGLASQLASAEEETRQAGMALDKARDVYDVASRRRQLAARIAERDALAEQLRRAQDAEAQLAVTEVRLAALGAVTPGDRDQAARLDRQLRELDLQLRIAGTTLTLDLSTSRQVEYRGSQGEGAALAIAGQPFEVFTLDCLELVIAGVGTVKVASGSGSARELEARKRAVEHELTGLLTRCGVERLAELERLADQRADLQARKTADHGLLVGCLQGAASASELAARRSTLAVAIMTGLAELGLSEGELGQTAIPAEEELKAAGQVARRIRDEKAAEETALRDRLASVGIQVQSLTAQVQALKSDQIACEEVMAQVLARYEGGLATLESEVAGAQAASVHAASELTELEAGLPPHDPDAAAIKARADLLALEARAQELHDQVVRLEGALGETSSLGLYEQETRCEEEIAQLQAQVDLLEARGRAVKFLLALAGERKRRLSSGLAQPLAERATALWEAVTGVPGRQVMLDDDLTIRGVRVLGQEHKIEPFSGGAREQLFVVARLALGEVLARHERQLVVIDDALVYSDPERFERLLAQLEGVGDRLQIVILTCDGTRYQHLSNARHLQLELPATV